VSNAVFTPHRGEKKAIEESFGSVDEFVDQTGNIVLVKGLEDRIYSEEGLEKVSRGHPGMTVGGTGDVLTGIVASLISQGLGRREAAVRAAEINGKAGEKAAEKYGNGLVATDLLEEIPKVMQND
jgi:NAD(P)H-hydrate epimerase